jgi:hypothetical protein
MDLGFRDFLEPQLLNVSSFVQVTNVILLDAADGVVVTLLKRHVGYIGLFNRQTPTNPHISLNPNNPKWLDPVKEAPATRSPL